LLTIHASEVQIKDGTAKWYSGNRGGGIFDDLPSDVALLSQQWQDTIQKQPSHFGNEWDSTP